MSINAKSSKKQIIELARNDYCQGSDDNVEIDDQAKVLKRDTGAWVAAWVYVRFEDKNGE